MGEKGKFTSITGRDARKHMRMVDDACKERVINFSTTPKIACCTVVRSHVGLKNVDLFPIAMAEVTTHNKKK